MKKKSGGKLTLEDFLPEFAKEKKQKKDGEANLKGFLMAMAKKKEK